MLNSTIANNYGLGGSGASFSNGGGGIGMNGGILSLTNCTVAGNSVAAGFVGGGIFLDNASSSVTILNSIVAGNLASGGEPDIDVWLGMCSSSYSLIGNASGSGLGSGNGNLLGVASDLGPLADNGGIGAPTNPPETMALQSGSPALEAGTFISSLSSAIASTTASSITIANNVFAAIASPPLLTTGSYFTIQIDGEQMNVTAVHAGSGSTATLTVSRAEPWHNGGHAFQRNCQRFSVSDERSHLPTYASSAVVNMGAFQGQPALNYVLSFTTQPSSTTVSDSLRFRGT